MLELDEYLNPGVDWDVINARGGVTGQPVVDTATLRRAPSSTAASGATKRGTYEDLWANYWAPDRREALVRSLETDYWAPDRDSRISQVRGLSDAQLFPYGIGHITGYGGSGNGSGPGTRWDEYYFRQNFGTPGTPNDLLALESRINAMGGKVLRNAAGVAGKVQTPDGRIVDVINAAGLGGRGFQWLEGGGYVPGGGEFTDPYGMQFEQGVAERLRSLLDEPTRDRLNQYVGRLLDADGRKQASTAQFVDALRGRVSELQAPPYTAGDEAVLRAKAFDALERRRAETIKNNREQVYARGFAPTSGLVRQADARTNRVFEEARTGIESNLLLQAIEETQRRKDQALGLEQIIEQALSGGDLASLQMLAQAAQMEDFTYQDRQAREREYLSTLGLSLDLMMNRAQLANQTAGLAANPQSIMASILPLLGQANNSRALTMQQQANQQAGMGQLLALLFPRGLRGGE